MPRLNGVGEIIKYLGVSEKLYRALLQYGLPTHRDPEFRHRVWAYTVELDRWDRGRSLKTGIAQTAPETRHASALQTVRTVGEAMLRK